MGASTSTSSPAVTSTSTTTTRSRTSTLRRTALSEALGTRDGVARYGAAIVPMDEARGTAAVDLVRRPHAEIALSFEGDRVGALAVSLLGHALERFAIEAGCTVHVDPRARTTTTSPRRHTRRSGRRCARRSHPARPASPRRRAWCEARSVPGTDPSGPFVAWLRGRLALPVDRAVGFGHVPAGRLDATRT